MRNLCFCAKSLISFTICVFPLLLKAKNPQLFAENREFFDFRVIYGYFVAMTQSATKFWSYKIFIIYRYIFKCRQYWSKSERLGCIGLEAPRGGPHRRSPWCGSDMRKWWMNNIFGFWFWIWEKRNFCDMTEISTTWILGHFPLKFQGKCPNDEKCRFWP